MLILVEKETRLRKVIRYSITVFIMRFLPCLITIKWISLMSGIRCVVIIRI